MDGAAVKHVRRVAVASGDVPARHDYADAFEARLSDDDVTSPEDWVRAGIDATPGWVGRLVGMFTGGEPRPDDMLGPFRVLSSDATNVRLEATLSWGSVTMVGRNVNPAVRTLTTAIRFERPVVGRAVWSLMQLGHRWAAPRIVASEVRGRRDA